MNGARVLQLEPLAKNAFSAFGEAALAAQGASPSTAGAGWFCWYPLARIRSERPLELGLVETAPVPRQVSVMERHTARPECVLALDAPIIQVVAPATASDRPAAEDARAFVIEPGQAVVMAPGTWHAAAMPVGAEAVRYIFLLPAPGPAEAAEGWTMFSGGETVDIQATRM
jgi:ureidoglycolate lyase